MDKTTTIVRPYNSEMAMKFDSEQFMQYPEVFSRRQPPARDFRVKLAVLKVELEKGNPPIKKHRMTLTVKVTGKTESDVDRWIAEAVKLTGAPKGMTASEQLRKYHQEQAKKA